MYCSHIGISSSTHVMQHVLRCQERQNLWRAAARNARKPFGGRGALPRSPLESLQRSPHPWVIAVACATVRLNTCSLAWAGHRPGYEPGPTCAKVRSSEFRRVCYRINILSPGSINLVLAQAGKVTRRSGVALAMRHRHRGLST